MRNVYISMILFSVLSISMGCKKDRKDISETDALPPASSIGANTAGCLVNGEAFISKRTGNFFSSQSNLFAFYHNGTFSLGLVKVNKTDSEYSAQINIHLSSLGIYTIKPDTPYRLADTMVIAGVGLGYATYSVSYLTRMPGYYGYNEITYYTTASSVGWVTFSQVDTANQHFSGTFSFDAILSSMNDTIHIREGRFDIKL